MWPFDQIGGAMADGIKDLVVSAFEAAMKAIWDASLALLRGAFTLADQFSVFTVDIRTGPVSILWPMMLWISGVLALGLFFWQLIMTSLRGGRGFLRLVGGPIQYGVALGVTVGLVAGFLTAVDGLTDGILQYGLNSRNFSDALTHTAFGDAAVDGIKAAVLGICAFIGVIPAAIGYVLEMLFREAAIYVLVACVPIVAAGLLSNVTASWFWRTCRWLLATIVMKPVLAMTLTLGVAIAGGSQGLSGLLAGVGVLILSLVTPFVLFRLFAFVDPNTEAGGAFRDALSSAGMDSYGANSPLMAAAGAAGGAGGGGAIEDANTDRFDAATSEQSGNSMDETGGGDSSSGENDGSGERGSQQSTPDSQAESTSSDGSSDEDAAAPPAAGDSAQAAAPPSAGGNDAGEDSDGGEPPAPDPPDSGGGPNSPNGGGSGPSSGGGAAGATEAEEAAVIM